MSERNYYVVCDDNCKFPSLTKEQILTAILQAVSTGEIKDVDTGFVTKIKEQNHNSALSFWVGTSAEYNALETKDDGCFYILTDDTIGDDLKKAIEELQTAIAALERKTAPCPQIVVTARGGDITCTDAKGEDVKLFKKIGNVWTFAVGDYGVYTISGVYGEWTETKTVEVTAVKQYPETIEYYSDTFAENDWATIIDVCQRGVVPEGWAVGDEKEVTLNFDGTPETLSVRIIGKAHDEYEDGTKAPFTFQFTSQKLYNADSGYGDYMNTKDTNVGGWAESEMRTVEMPELFGYLPTELQAAIRNVKKLTSVGNADSTIGVTYDGLFLLSEVERFGEVKISAAGEGSQYEYFKNGNFLGNGKHHYWLRSPVLTDTKTFCVCVQNVYGESVKAVSTTFPSSGSFTYALAAFCL